MTSVNGTNLHNEMSGQVYGQSQQAAAGTPDSQLVWTTDKYNSLGQMIEVDQPQVADPKNPGQMITPVTKYGYDAYGHEITQTDANLGTTTFYFDALGRAVGQKLPDWKGASKRSARGREIGPHRGQ